MPAVFLHGQDVKMLGSIDCVYQKGYEDGRCVCAEIYTQNTRICTQHCTRERKKKRGARWVEQIQLQLWGLILMAFDWPSSPAVQSALAPSNEQQWFLSPSSLASSSPPLRFLTSIFFFFLSTLFYHILFRFLYINTILSLFSRLF